MVANLEAESIVGSAQGFRSPTREFARKELLWDRLLLTSEEDKERVIDLYFWSKVNAAHKRGV